MFCNGNYTEMYYNFDNEIGITGQTGTKNGHSQVTATCKWLILRGNQRPSKL